MPIYEYRCDHCGHELEALQKISDAPLTVCPKCQQAALKKLVSAAGFRLKGSGWYETDFKKDKRRNVVAEGDAGGKGEAKAGADAGKTDAAKAPAAAAEAKPKATPKGGGSPAGDA